MEKYARKCDCCSKGMNSGYYDAGSYWCSDRCLIWGNSEDKPYTMEDWEKDHEQNSDECYYTEWDEVDEDEYFDEDGNVYTECSDCNKHTAGLGDYCGECLTHK